MAIASRWTNTARHLKMRAAVEAHVLGIRTMDALAAKSVAQSRKGKKGSDGTAADEIAVVERVAIAAALMAAK
jgi:hypothetical protein